MEAVVPVSDADVSDTVLPRAAVLSLYWATKPARATFDGVFASPAGTFTNTSALLSVMVLEVVRSYVFVEAVTKEPPIVSGRCVMFAVKVGWVSE